MRKTYLSDFRQNLVSLGQTRVGAYGWSLSVRCALALPVRYRMNGGRSCDGYVDGDDDDDDDDDHAGHGDGDEKLNCDHSYKGARGNTYG